MYWYWTDDIAKVLLENHRIDAKLAESIAVRRVAYRSTHTSLLEAAEALLDGEEVPLAA